MLLDPIELLAFAMNDLLGNYLKLLVLYTPFFGLSCFLAMTKKHTPRQRQRLAWQVAAATLAASIALFLFGRLVFILFAITADAFRIGAGCVLFLTALNLAQGKETIETTETGRGIAIVPLTIPLTVGPGTIGALLVMGVNQTLNARLSMMLGIVLASATVGLMLFLSDHIARILGKDGLQVMSRLMGLFICAVAAQIIFVGIQGYFPAITGIAP